MLWKQFFVLLCALFFVACLPFDEEPKTDVEPTAAPFELPSLGAESPPVLFITPTSAAAVTIPADFGTPTAVPSAATLPPPPVVVEATATAAPSPVPTLPVIPPTTQTLYKVIDVASNDVLNMRGGAGVDYDLVGSIPPQATGLLVTGAGQQVDGYTWVPVQYNNVNGWVNSRFLQELTPAERICQEEGAKLVIQQLRQAIETQNGVLLSQIAHPAGLGVRLSWWNPEVKLTPAELPTIFTSPTSYKWGIQDGSGFDLTGPFADQVLPFLNKDLLPATQLGCNEILAGPTTGLLQLPTEYEGTSFFTLYRPAPELGIEFDWGSWVIGLELVDNRYVVKYLIHFKYEI